MGCFLARPELKKREGGGNGRNREKFLFLRLWDGEKWKKSQEISILIIFIFIFLFVVGKNGGKFHFRKIRLISEIARYKALSPNPYKYLSLGRYIYINFIFLYIGLLTTATRNFCGRFEVLDGK